VLESAYEIYRKFLKKHNIIFRGKIIQEKLTGWNLPEKIFMMIRAPHYIISIILTIIFILLFEILGKKVMPFNCDYNKFDSIILSFLIGFLLFGIQFFLNKMRQTFEELGNLFENKDLSAGLQNQILRNFTNSKLYYLIILFVILPFLIIQISDFWSELFYSSDPSYWAFILDLYNNLLNYISLYLLAIILWIIFNISWSFDMINSAPYRMSLKINLFKADKMGGLRPLRGLIVSFSMYYFVLIVLFIMSWLRPSPFGYSSLGPDCYCYPYCNPSGYSLKPYESTFLAIFWIIGTTFFIWGWYAIRRLLFGKIEDEINYISDLCQYKTKQLSDLVSKDDSPETERHLNQISNALDALHKERERILALGPRSMDIKTILLFLGSSIPSLIAIIKTLEDARKMEITGFVIDNFQHIVNQLINYFYHINK
jgi:hypothetical protein